MTDDIGSWEMQVDFALGQARRVLEATTEAFVTHSAKERVGAGVSLAGAWCDLAEVWADRQLREMELGDRDDESTPAEAVPCEFT